MKSKPTVLLTTAYGPHELGWGEDMYDMFTSRLSRGQGIFSITSHSHCFGLYLIAENMSCPTTVLENPHWDEFEAELEREYDYIGFQLKSIHTDKIADMVALARKRSPRSKIVIGGYGVSTLHDPVPGDERGSANFILANSDYLCREEGVQFMRRILDDEPVDRPITQYHLPFCGISIKALKRRYLRFPIVLVSLGCPNACNFCNTSAFFHHKKIYVADPEQTYDFMKNYARCLRSDNLVTTLFDEDIFQNAEYVRELGRLIRSDRKTWKFRWSSFGSIRALSQFEPEELRDCGVGTVWVGVESIVCDDPQRAGKDYLPKRLGDVERIISGLHNNGIMTIGSVILGFDFHTPENIERDIDYFVKLKPTFYQIGPLTPCPGTALYERIKEEERLYYDYQWKDFHLWKNDVFKLHNFKPNEISKYFDLAHKKLVEENGPSVLSAMEVFLNGYQSLEGESDEFHQEKRRNLGRMASLLHGTMEPLMRYGPSEAAKARADELDRRYHEIMGRGSLGSRMFGKVSSWRISQAARRPIEPVASDPPARWTYYHHEPAREVIYVRKGHGDRRIRRRKERMFLIG